VKYEKKFNKERGQMKRVIIFISTCLFCAFFLATFSHAAPIPDLKGVWKGTVTVAWVHGGTGGTGPPPQHQSYLNHDITITIYNQNQDLFFGRMEVRQTYGPSYPPSVSVDFAGVIYGDNELHFCIGDPQSAIGFGKLSQPSSKLPLAQVAQTISGHWVGSLGSSPPYPYQGTAARYSITRKNVVLTAPHPPIGK
jgi:hypothetical protein